MDRRELEIMLNDAFDRGIVTARAVEGIYPPAVTVGILDDLGREIDFGHEGSGLTVFLPGIEDDARFAGSCKALGGKVPQNTYRMELVSAIAGELMGAESATALSALESALDRARRRGYCVFDRGIHDDVPDPGLVYLCSTYPAAVRLKDSLDFSDSQGIIRSMGADQAAEIKKEAELAQIKAAEEVAIRQNQLDLKQADLKKQADKAKAEADMVKATVTAEKQRELYIAQQEAEIAAETKKVELAERQADVRERELNATVKKQAEADRYAAEQAAEADLYKRTKQAEAARIERQNQSDAELYSAQKDAEGIQARAKAEAEATRLKGESEGAVEKAHGEGVAAGIKAQAEAYNGMDNPYLLANRYIDIMPKVAEQVAKPLTAVDSIKMYGSGNAQKLVKETTSIVDQVASGLKDSTGIDLPSLLNGLISNPDIDAGSAENSVE